MATPSPTSTGVSSALDAQSGRGQGSSGISISTFVASLAAAIIIFAVEFLLFVLLKSKLTRIYQPRTYLVPERERPEPSPAGLFRWILPVFQTSNSEFIKKCGLDAYFFLRYLRMLLKIFIPLAILILPVLLPLNKSGGRDQNPVTSHNGSFYNVTGLDQLAWGNVKPENTDRYWGHLVLAVIVVIYVCAIFFDELRSYIRLRQSYLTSPQHRIRASATTVLVTAIPTKWLTVDALYNLYDVFPGGVRNIWLNRNMDQLNEKVKLRSEVALKLESAETELIKKCKKSQLKQAKKDAKKAGKRSSQEITNEQEAADKRATQLAESAGVSAGNPHNTPHTIREMMRGRQDTTENGERRRKAVPLVGGTVNAVGTGMSKIKNTVLGGPKPAVNATANQPVPADVTLELQPDEDSGSQRPKEQNGETSNDAQNRHEEDPDPSSRAVPPGEEATAGPSTIAEHPEVTSPTVEESGDRPPLSRRPTGLRRKGQSWRSSASNPQGDELPLTAQSPLSPDFPGANADGADGKLSRKAKRTSTKTDDKAQEDDYPIAYNEEYEEDDYGEPTWMKYIKESDRETIRLPIFGWTWMPALPLMGKKVDKIYHCRKELARLNLEIEIDQQHPEKFPLMNSAFVQFNHQVAAHMACQSVSHHIPKQMAPRMVEISPDDVIWDNMSVRWWERYLRTFGVIIIVCAMVIGWAFPVAFTGLLSQLSYLQGNFTWLRWLGDLPEWLISAIQGILPPLFLAILMALLPLILRFLTRNQGVHTGMGIELTVQNYFFAFLFVQVFLVVSISSGFSTVFNSITDVTSVPSLLAENIPKASNYFFSYMILQAMSVSAGALVQIFGLVSWFILAPMMDSTGRMKWARTTNLNQMQWGTFFPVYTTLASIGLIYSIISPLILVFNVITFGLFWVVYRYNTLYVTKFRFDTGGLLFPKAVNQLFTGIYVMEICLIGMFFLVRDETGSVACEGQAICMIVVLVLTILFQYFLNEAFNPLIRYLPITLEEEATKRDEVFAHEQRRRLGLDDDDDDENDDKDGLDQTEAANAQDKTVDKDPTTAKGDKEEPGTVRRVLTGQLGLLVPGRNGGKNRQSWADRSGNSRSPYFGGRSDASVPTVRTLRERMAEDAESQAPNTKAIGHSLFSGIHDELEDLTPDERDQLVQRAFQHEALRARRPVVWVPRDDLGVSDDEIFRIQRFSKHIWISNEYQALDGKVRAIFSRSPPDFSEVDLIQL